MKQIPRQISAKGVVTRLPPKAFSISGNPGPKHFDFGIVILKASKTKPFRLWYRDLTDFKAKTISTLDSLVWRVHNKTISTLESANVSAFFPLEGPKCFDLGAGF